jgi:glycosyltransferase involved in cell wall biosynthesis
VKIAHVSPAFHPAHVYGGPTYSAYRLCSAVAAAGCEVRVLTTDANGSDRTLAVDTSREVQMEPRLSVRYCHRISHHSVSPALLRHLPEVLEWADVVHLTAVYNFTTFPTLFACKMSRKPLVWSPRGGFQRWEGSTRRHLKHAWETVSWLLAPQRLALHVTSDDEARQSMARFPGARAVVIPNGIDMPCESSREPSAHLRMLYVGRLHPIKGIENLLAACRLLAKDWDRPWTLTIAGDGAADYRSRLEDIVHDTGLQDRVKFIGHTLDDAKEALFTNADVVVVPSHSENFGIVVAEALSHGVPVIAATGTPWARVEEMNCGLWVANDPDTLADAIRRIDQLPRAEMGVRARRWMQAEFSWPRIAARTLELYEETSRA